MMIRHRHRHRPPYQIIIHPIDSNGSRSSPLIPLRWCNVYSERNRLHLPSVSATAITTATASVAAFIGIVVALSSRGNQQQTLTIMKHHCHHHHWCCHKEEEKATIWQQQQQSHWFSNAISASVATTATETASTTLFRFTS